MKELIRDWEKRFPGRVENMFNALGKVVPSHLMDHKLFPFGELRATGEADPSGDIAFDEDPCASESSLEQTISIVQFDDI
jgi:tRNA 2-thiocytidine biosynthesis protein TtcA